MGRPNKAAAAKRERERTKRAKQAEKLARRAKRKDDKAAGIVSDDDTDDAPEGDADPAPESGAQGAPDAAEPATGADPTKAAPGAAG